MKTVGEFVKELLELDQTKPIWVYYDCYADIVPEVDVADGNEFPKAIKQGDYKIDAW